MKIRKILFAAIILASATIAAPANAIDWKKVAAPKACLPQKATEWGTRLEYLVKDKNGVKHPSREVTKACERISKSKAKPGDAALCALKTTGTDVVERVNKGEQEACFCPPAAQFCPPVEIDRSNIKFIVNILGTKPAVWKTQTFTGEQVGDFVLQTLIDKASDLAYTTSIVKDEVLRSNNLMLAGKYTDLTKTKSNWRKYTIDVHFDITDFEQKMPGDLSAQCCPSLCASGLNFATEEKQIPVEYKPIPQNVVNLLDRKDFILELKDNIAAFDNKIAAINAFKKLTGIDTFKGFKDKNKAQAIAHNAELGAELKMPLEEKYFNDADFRTSFDTKVFNMLKSGKSPSLSSIKSLVTTKLNAVNNSLKPHLDAEGNIIQQVARYKTLKVGACVAVVGRSRSGCLSEGTKITLANGDSISIEQLKVGDVLKTMEGDSEIVALNKFAQEYDEMYSINGERAFITIEHPILTDNGWKAIDPTKTKASSELGMVQKLEIGDKIITSDGSVEVKSIDKHKISENALAYNIKVENGKPILADGKYVSGFKLVEINY